ncbi:MAG: putative farnesylated protein converting enzyme 1 [Streblomastix strix]|uniref:Putative farnesylated protein converting enzyme 1 n=1 Tax=Streblomastix strix TaxID=222440 RepID=A0A5J4WAV9_9EUKA|nr:MAG: putative farnesylated protein converting enzyme 1 [Streblomastix strix]
MYMSSALILHIPLKYYYNFFVEQKYGFNKRTKLVFFKDNLYIVLITTLLLVISFDFLVWLIDLRLFSEYYWISAFAIFAVFGMIITYAIFPVFIKILIGSTVPLQEVDIDAYTAIEQLYQKCGFNTKKVLMSLRSKRSTHANAFVMDMFGVKQVVLYDNLLQLAGIDTNANKVKQLQNQDLKEQTDDRSLQTDKQDGRNNELNQSRNEKLVIKDPKVSGIEKIVAVLAHEIGHQKYWHTYKLLVFVLVAVFFLFFIFSQLKKTDFFAIIFGFIGEIGEKIEYNQEFVNLFGIFVAIKSHLSLIMWIINILQRRLENQADQYAVKLGYGQALGNFLISMSKENLSDLNPDPLYI